MSKVAQLYYNLKGDTAIWLIVTFLVLASMLAVYSATGSMAYKYKGGNTEAYLIQHAIYMLLGLGTMYVCSKLHYSVYAKLAPILFVITIPLLIYTVGFGKEINEARRWIQLPFTDFTFQTSDLAKVTLIMFIARGIAKRQDNIKDLKGAFLPIIIPIVIVCGLIAPSDLSTAVLLFVTSFLMMFIGRMSLKYLALLILVGVVAFALIALVGSFFPEFVRVETWQTRLHDFMFNTDGGYQIQQSKMAIARGGLLGVGPGDSIQRDYLPYPYADFIYAIICEEYGVILGGLGILLLYLLLLYRCTKLVTRCPKTFGAILAMGLCLNIVIQAFANIAVSVHLVPVTGLTLPLVSMGGTSLIFTCITFGMILSVSRYVDDYQKRQNEILVTDASTD